MFKMMNSSVCGLLASSCPKISKDTEDSTHPWICLRQSLASLGASSFMNGAQYKPMSAQFNIPQAINQCTVQASQVNKGNNNNNGSSHCPRCSQYWQNCRCTQTDSRTQQGLVLKDNSKFMVTDNLQVFESSTIKAMELMKEHVDDFRGIQTATVSVTEDYVRKFILCSLLGSNNVFTELFPDGGESDGSFEAIDPPKKNGKSRKASMQDSTP